MMKMMRSLGRSDDHCALRGKNVAGEVQFYLKRKNLAKANCENSNENPLPISFLLLSQFLPPSQFALTFSLWQPRKVSFIRDGDKINTILVSSKEQKIGSILWGLLKYYLGQIKLNEQEHEPTYFLCTITQTTETWGTRSIAQYYISLLSGIWNIDDQYRNPNINKRSSRGQSTRVPVPSHTGP